MTWLVLAVAAVIFGAAICLACVVAFAVRVLERDEIDEGY